MEKEYENAVFQVLNSFFEKYDSASLQKRSFDNFITHRLPKIIEEEPCIEVSIKKNEFFRVEFGQVFVDRPYIVDERRSIQYILPSEAMLRDLTYSSVLSINIYTKHFSRNDNDGEEEVLEERYYTKIAIARIPMMVGSYKCNLNSISIPDRRDTGHCANDSGGYFIIKGKERVLVAQERANYNTVYVFEKKNTDQKHIMVSEIRSMSDETGHSVLIQMKITSNMRLVVNLPFISQEIPLGFVFVAYGCDTKKIDKILRKNSPEHKDIDVIINSVLKDALIIQTEENAINHISQFATHVIAKEKRVPYVKQILMNEVFPHLGIASNELNKILFLGHMCGKLLTTYIGMRPLDDRDHLSNKRIEVSGVLIGDLFRTLWKRFIRTIIPQLVKRLDIITIISKVNVITMGLRHCFSTGNWGIPKSNYIRTGVSQVLSRLSYNSTLSHLRRIVIPIGKEGRNTKIRQVHSTHIGFVCSSETPEGSSAGVVKNFTLASDISLSFDPMYMRMVIESVPDMITDLTQFFEYNGEWTKVFVNGNWIGIVKDGESAYKFILRMKDEHNLIPYHISIVREDNEIRVYCDDGRMIRPLFDARNMPTIEELNNKHWDLLVEERKIVWLDPHELEDKHIAMFPHEITDTTELCEIHPCLMLGICSSMMPFADHTQSPRICYHASMVKQSIGIYCSTNEVRADTVAHILSNPEKPIVRSHVEEWMKLVEMPCGNNVIVAIACYGGWNQEDSIILNQSSVDNGLFRSFTYRTIMVEEKKKTSSQIETIDLPPNDIRIRSYNYSKLDTNGIVKHGVFVGSGDVIVAKVSTHQIKVGREEKVDTSVIIRNGEEGFVDKVFITTTPDGYKMVKIKLRTLKIPEIGDKLCSNCAQKGTIGMTLRREDMPYTPDGIVPDIIINPLCFTADTRVAFQDGLSRQITFGIAENVWSFDQYSKQMVVSHHMGGEFKKYTDVMELRRDDGTTIKCTPEHMFMIYNNGQCYWKEAQLIDLNKDKIVAGVELPEDIIENDDIRWRDMIDNHIFKLITEDRLDTLALFRLAGFYHSLLIPCERTWEFFDNEVFKEDLNHLPILFSSSKIGDMTLYDKMKEAPACIKREFIATFIGLNSVVDEEGVCAKWLDVNKDTIDTIRYIAYILLREWEVKVSVKEVGKSIYLYIKDVVNFQKNVGFRYVPFKSLQLTVVSSYKRQTKITLWKKFLEESNAGWFYRLPKSSNILPFWTTKIVSREMLPEKQNTYCIGVAKHHCFLAESMLVQNCIPSRMTINQLMESIGAKSAVMKGKFRYATTFSRHSVDVVEDLKMELKESGYERNGNEFMINGMTGQMMDAEIFIGPCYYHRLKHLVSAKIHARNHGKVSQLTRQPLEGRSREGGLRFGEMERDAIISAGSSRFLLERLFDMSDPFKVPVCVDCGTMPPSNNTCQVCEGTNIQFVHLPYACKLLFQELNAMSIRVNMFPEKDEKNS